MTQLLLRWRAFKAEQSGATLVEYGLLVGLMSIASLLVVIALGTQLASLFDSAQSAIPEPPPPVAPD